MPISRYRTDQFVDSGWDSGTPERKAKFVNALLRFIADGFPEDQFTRQLYMGLSTHGHFGFIAHYNIHGFYDEQLSTPERQHRFLHDLARSCERGAGRDQPDMWSDVKSALARHLSHRDEDASSRQLQSFRGASPRRPSHRDDAPTLF